MKKNVKNLYKISFYYPDSKIKIRQYFIFIQPRNFDTAVIKCFTVF